MGFMSLKMMLIAVSRRNLQSAKPRVAFISTNAQLVVGMSVLKKMGIPNIGRIGEVAKQAAWLLEAEKISLPI